MTAAKPQASTRPSRSRFVKPNSSLLPFPPFSLLAFMKPVFAGERQSGSTTRPVKPERAHIRRRGGSLCPDLLSTLFIYSQPGGNDAPAAL